MSQYKYLDLAGLQAYNTRLRSGVLKFRDAANGQVTYRPGDTIDLSKGIYYATTCKTATQVSNPITFNMLDGTGVVWRGDEKCELNIVTHDDLTSCLKFDEIGAVSSGYDTEANGEYSFAAGVGTIANSEAEFATGKYNASGADTLFSVGNGTSDTDRKNAFELTSNAGYINGKKILTEQTKQYRLEYIATESLEDIQPCDIEYSKHECTYIDDETVKGVFIYNEAPTSIREDAFIECTSLMSIVIPDSVTSIWPGAFGYCDNLTSVTIPDSVTTIGYRAFEYCDSLTSITIPDSVTSIGSDAFVECSSLISVIIGNSVTSIGELAFSDCTSLTNVYCKAMTPPTGDYSMFEYNDPGRKIYVPHNSVDAYKSADGWSDYYYREEIVGAIFEDEHLIPGQNIKTINGESLLGSGDIKIEPNVDLELNPDSNNPIANSAVTNAIKGGVHFRGVYDRLPDELVDATDGEGNEIDYEIKQIGIWYGDIIAGDFEKPIEKYVIFYEGDVIIVTPNMGDGDSDGEYIPGEPTKEYILTYANGAVDEWRWVELGDVAPAQDMINELLKNYYKKTETYKKSEVDSRISSVQSKFSEYVPRDTYTESYNEGDTEQVIIRNQDIYGSGWMSDLYRTSDMVIEPHKITLSTYADYASDETEEDYSRSNTLELSAGQGLRFNGNEVLTSDANNNLSKSELKIGQVEISNSDQQPNYTFNGKVYMLGSDYVSRHNFDIVAEWDGEDPESHVHPYYSESIEVCKFVVTSINWEDDESEYEDENWRSHVEDVLLSEDGKLFISVECMNDTTIQVTDSKSWIESSIYDAGGDSISGTITVTAPLSLKKLSKLTVNGNEVLAVDNEGVLDKNTLIITDGEYNQFIVGNDFGLMANHTYEMDGETMQTMFASSPIDGAVGGVVSYASNQIIAQSGFVASGQMVNILSGGENSETGESALTQLIVHPGGATINNQPILTGTRIEDSKILSLFS